MFESIRGAVNGLWRNVELRLSLPSSHHHHRNHHPHPHHDCYRCDCCFVVAVCFNFFLIFDLHKTSIIRRR